MLSNKDKNARLFLMKKALSLDKKTRNLKKTRNELLQVAFVEIFSHGFQGVSIDEIVKKTNLTKGAFYHHFPTKLDLGYALVDEVITPMILNRWILPLKSLENPITGILLQIKKLIGSANPQQLKLGCPLNNLVQEMSSVDAGFNLRLNKALNIWINETNKLLKKAKKNGFLKKEINTKQVATFVVMAHEGFYGLLKGTADLKIFDALYNSLLLYFKSIQEEIQ